MVWARSSLMVLIISSAMDSKAQSNGANPLISISICLQKERTIPSRILRAQIYFPVTKY
jgi:hypothetical protein